MKRAVDERVQQLIDPLPEEFIEAWEERSAVREYDGGLSRPHAEAMALLDLLDGEPELLSSVRAYRVHLDAATLGGEIAARRSVAWTVDEEFGGLAELVAV